MIKWTLLLFTLFCLLLTRNSFGGQEQSEVSCLTEAIYYESRGETLMSQLAVCNVVHQGCQFSYYCDGKPENMLDKTAKAMSLSTAQFVLSGASVWGLDNATHYHAYYVEPKWSKVFKYLQRVGSHLFYQGK